MKQFKLTAKIVLSLCIIAILASCSNEKDEVEEQQIDYSEVAKSSEIDQASEALEEVTLKVYETQEVSESSKMPPNFNLPDCVTITVVAQQNYREVTLDFGSEGCLVNGNILKGVIALTYTRNPQAQEILITKTFTDFYFNAKHIQGGNTILKQRQNDNGNPQFTNTTTITVIWPDGATATRNGVKIREWVEGHGSGVWSDNVFEITGNWTTTFVNGNTHSYTVLTPLRREVICFYFVNGSIDVVRTNFSGVFDYGDGSCDNLATFTFSDGTVVDITLN